MCPSVGVRWLIEPGGSYQQHHAFTSNQPHPLLLLPNIHASKDCVTTVTKQRQAPKTEEGYAKEESKECNLWPSFEWSSYERFYFCIVYGLIYECNYFFTIYPSILK